MKRKISVFISSQIEHINQLINEGYTLKSIYEDIHNKFDRPFSYNTFSTSFYRAQKKIAQNIIKKQSIETFKEVSINNEHKTEKEINANVITTSINIKNSDPFSED